MKRAFFFLSLWVVICNCSYSTGNKSDSNSKIDKINDYAVNAVLYNELSGEYHALALQAFNLARLRIDQKLPAYGGKTDSLAIIVDIDETILNNSTFEGQLILDDSSFNDEWGLYIKEMKATAIPGAVEYLNYVDNCFKRYHCKKIRIFYITNRDSTQFSSTAKNLARLHFPQIDTINFKNDFNLKLRLADYNKESRFKEVMDHYKVLLQLGDNLNDFSGDFYNKSDRYRDSLVGCRNSVFGEDYIVLPNAMYGDWLTALSKQNFYTMSPQSQDSIIYKSIKGFK